MRKPVLPLSFCLALAALVLVFPSAGAQNISLDGTWKLSYWKQPVRGPVTDPAGMQKVAAAPSTLKTIPATVPGNVELDLQKAGLLGELTVGDNVYQVRQYEGYQWCYSRWFPTPAHTKDQTLRLTFRGLDCLASVWLNGKLVGTADNMFIEHSFDITDLVVPSGVNDLKVIIRSAVLEAQNFAMQSISGRNDEQAYIRKAASQYGWDILPRVVSAGLWRGVELDVPANGRTQIARIPARSGQGVLLIRYTVGGVEYKNHCLYGDIPFRLDDYRAWMAKAGIYQ